MSFKKFGGLMALAVVMSGPWMVSRASAVQANVPVVNVFLNGNWVAPITGQTAYSEDGTSYTGSGWSNDFSWSFWGDSDPLINWSFSASTPGTYSVVFTSPVVGGPYTILRNQAAVAVSDIGAGTNSTWVDNVSIDGQVPTGTSVPAVLLTGDLLTLNGATAHLSYGPVTTIGSFSPATYSEALNFKLWSPDGDGSAAFTGQLVLTPEPASLGLLGLGVMGWMMKRRR